jgi:hypothetical protein
VQHVGPVLGTWNTGKPPKWDTQLYQVVAVAVAVVDAAAVAAVVVVVQTLVASLICEPKLGGIAKSTQALSVIEDG